MKLNKFLWSLAAISALSLASCAADKVADEPEITPSDLTSSRFLAVTINTAPDSRANGYEEGLDPENNVTSSRFYFFDDEGNAVAVSATSNNAPATGTSTETSAVNWINGGALTPVGTNMDNVEEILKTVLIIRTPDRDKGTPAPTGLPTKMVVCLNLPSTFSSAKLSLSQLEDMVADYSAHTDGNFYLSSTVYANTDPTTTKVVAVNITTGDLKDSEQAAILAPVTVYVERVVAKVRLTLKNDEGTINITDALTTGSGADQVVFCKTGQKIDHDGNSTTPEVDLYARLEPWYLTAESNKSYLIKNINTTTWTAALPWSGWNNATNFRSHWALNPTTGWDVVYHKYTAPEGSNTDPGKVATASYTKDVNFLYTQENANYVNADSKTDPTKNTKVLVKATLGYLTTDGNASSFTPLEFGTFGTTRYPIVSGGTDYLAKAILDYLKLQDNLPYYWYDTDNSKYKQISEGDITYVTISSLKTGYNGTNTEGTTPLVLAEENRYLVRVQLSEAGQGKIWYDKDDTDPTAYGSNASGYDTMDDTEKKAESAKAVNKELLDAITIPVMVWKGGQTYYFFDIKHLNTTGTFTKGNEPEGYFGVVRNHIYDCTINGVTGLGTPVYNPDEYIIPETVDDDIYTAVAASINIHSWRIVTNSYTLGE